MKRHGKHRADPARRERTTGQRRFQRPFPVLDEAARAASLEAILTQRPGCEAVWVFAYGGLMWRPVASPCEVRPAELRGWHRSLCIWTVLARGTPERPGLALGLQPGGRCIGMAQRYDLPDGMPALEAIWQRELLTDAAEPRWLEAATDRSPLPVVAFVANPASAQVAPAMPPAEAARYVATAEGENGRCRDYLANTLAELRRLGADEPELQAVLAEADRLAPNVR